MFDFLRHRLHANVLAFLVKIRVSGVQRKIDALTRERKSFLMSFHERERRGESNNDDLLYLIEKSEILTPTDQSFEKRVKALESKAQYHSSRVSQIETEYLEKQAQRLMIPLPSSWIGFGSSKAHLAGVAELRSAIRKERKERFEAYQSKVALILSIIGAVTGLISLYISIYGHIGAK